MEVPCHSDPNPVCGRTEPLLRDGGPACRCQHRHRLPRVFSWTLRTLNPLTWKREPQIHTARTHGGKAMEMLQEP